MTLHLLCGRWWPTVCPPSGAFVTSRRNCIIISVCILMSELNNIHCYTQVPMVHLIQVPRDSPDTFTRAEVLTYYRSACYSECGMWIVMYIYIHLLKYKRTSSRKTFLSYLFEQKWPHHELFHFCLFVWISIQEWHDLIVHSIYCVEESNASRKDIYLLFIWYK